MELLTAVGISALGGLTYAVFGFWKVHKGEDFELKKVLPELFYGIVVGAAAVLLVGDLTASIASTFATGLSGSVLIDKAVGGLKPEGK